MKEGAQDYLIKGQMTIFPFRSFSALLSSATGCKEKFARAWRKLCCSRLTAMCWRPVSDIGKLVPAMSASIQEVLPHDFAAMGFS